MDVKTFNLQGTAPLCVHNGRLANPMCEYSKAIKVISGKRKRTDEDHEEIAKLEWLGSLYLNRDGKYILPGVGIEAALKDSAKLSKLGKVFGMGLMCPEDPLIQFKDMALPPEKLWLDINYRSQKLMRVQTSRVVRTVPQFPVWEIKVEIAYMPELINEATLCEVVETCGRLKGMFEYRPHYGRFQVL